jgi:hypothetical protein
MRPACGLKRHPAVCFGFRDCMPRSETLRESAAETAALRNFPERAAPFPLFGSSAKSGGDRIHRRIGATSGRVVIVAGQMVVVLLLPERGSVLRDNLKRLFGRERFPTVENVAERLRSVRVNHRMNMVRHHDPRMEPAALSVEEAQGVRDQIGDLGLLQETSAVAGIEMGIHPGRIPTEQLVLFLPGKRTFGGQGLAQDRLALRLQSGDEFTGKRSEQAKGDEVGAAFAFEMRQGVPCVKPGDEVARFLEAFLRGHGPFVAKAPEVAKPRSAAVPAAGSRSVPLRGSGKGTGGKTPPELARETRALRGINVPSEGFGSTLLAVRLDGFREGSAPGASGTIQLSCLTNNPIQTWPKIRDSPVDQAL